MKYDYFQAAGEKIILQVLVKDGGNKEAFVSSTVERKIWLVSGKGADFHWYPGGNIVKIVQCVSA